MKQIFVSQGKVVVKSVPAPLITSGSILVKTGYSCVSFGTESTTVQHANIPLPKRALKNPEKVLQVGRMALTQGFVKTANTVSAKLKVKSSLGYSASGTVIGVGQGVDDFEVGDLVACAGANFANHAEVISVPKNLAVRIPKNVDLMEASTVTLGAIAIQSVRRLSPQIGEVVGVIGLGSIGALVCQILRANGCDVVGVDTRQERIELLKQVLNKGFKPESKQLTSYINKITNGMGCDGVIIAASSADSTAVEQAMRMSRKKGKVVVLGDVGLTLKRENFYKKEIDFLISTSYGPGQYDHSYEQEGTDYPYAYVRWTENRNMKAYLNLIADKSIEIKTLGKTVFDLDRAEQAFDGTNNNSTFSFFRYDKKSDLSNKTSYLTGNKFFNKIDGSHKIKVGIIGASEFAKSTHIPNLGKLKDLYEIIGVASKTGLNADETARLCGAKFCSTNYKTIIQDPDISTILICTRHDLHGKLVIECLRAGKNVFVEKPMCITKSELNAIAREIGKAPATSSLYTGFNRRHSKIMVELRNILRLNEGPKMLNYVFNAGWLPPDHWVFGSEGGGRNIGEACHIYDLFSFLLGCDVATVTANAVRGSRHLYQSNDNFVATISYSDGSLCNLFYSAMGDTKIDKEILHVYCGGKVLEMRNYKTLIDLSTNRVLFQNRNPDKGHLQQFACLASSIKKGEHLVPFAEQKQAMNVAFTVEKQIQASIRQNRSGKL